MLVLSYPLAWLCYILTSLSSQVFDLVLNKEHVVVSDLDIFARAGGAAAHDEVTRFRIEDGQLEVMGEASEFGGVLSVEFSKVGV